MNQHTTAGNARRFDIAIIGYGPVGATAANLLGRMGFDVAVIDRREEIFDKPRAISLDHEAMRTFQAAGIADDIAPILGTHPGTDFVGVDGGVIKIFNPMPEPFTLGWTPTLTFVQPELEAVLRKGAARYPNVSFFPGFEATAEPATHRDAQIVLRRQGGGDSQQLSARYVLACDGANSPARNRENIPLDDLGFDEHWIVIDAWAKDVSVLPKRFIQYCRPWRPGTYVVGPRNLRRWEMKLLPGETPEDFASEDRMRDILGQFTDLSNVDIWRTTVYQFHAVVAQRWRQDNLFLLGDAAHQTPPFLAQGLCAGIRDVINLGWKLDMVLRRGAPERLLDLYERERKPHVSDVVAAAKTFGLIIGELDADKAAIRDRELREELQSGRAQTIRQKFIPDLRAGLLLREPSGELAPAAGTLFVQPHAQTQEGEAKLLDDTIPHAFLLVSDKVELLENLPAGLVARLEAIGCQRVLLAAADGKTCANIAVREPLNDLFAGFCASHSCHAAIVRPDRYVYGVADDTPALVSALDKLLGELGH